MPGLHLQASSCHWGPEPCALAGGLLCKGRLESHTAGEHVAASPVLVGPDLTDAGSYSTVLLGCPIVRPEESYSGMCRADQPQVSGAIPLPSSQLHLPDFLRGAPPQDLNLPWRTSRQQGLFSSQVSCAAAHQGLKLPLEQMALKEAFPHLRFPFQ